MSAIWLLAWQFGIQKPTGKNFTALWAQRAKGNFLCISGQTSSDLKVSKCEGRMPTYQGFCLEGRSLANARKRWRKRLLRQQQIPVRLFNRQT